MKLDTMFKLTSLPLKGVHRMASTVASASGRAQLLQKRDDDVIVTFAKRTAMGRAKKGQLKDVPVDELLHGLFKVRVVTVILFSVCGLTSISRIQATLEKTKLKPALIDDICVGTLLSRLGCILGVIQKL
jgi:acetyl-CoA acyltransferase 1